MRHHVAFLFTLQFLLSFRLARCAFYTPCLTFNHNAIDKSILQAADVSQDNDSAVAFNDEKIALDLFSGSDKRPVILFDGVCNLCNGGVNFALDHDEVGKFRFASLQSRVGQALLVRAGKRRDDISSIVLCETNKTYFKSDAVLRIARKLDGSIAALGYLGPVVPKFARNMVYDLVANNRYLFGEADQCRLDSDEFNNRFVSDP